MKKVLFTAAAILTLTAFQSCSKCGHCHTETTYTSGGLTSTVKNDGSVYCGNSANESGSYAKAAELECKAWAGQQPVATGYSYSSSWVTNK